MTLTNEKTSLDDLDFCPTLKDELSLNYFPISWIGDVVINEFNEPAQKWKVTFVIAFGAVALDYVVVGYDKNRKELSRNHATSQSIFGIPMFTSLLQVQLVHSPYLKSWTSVAQFLRVQRSNFKHWLQLCYEYCSEL